MFDRPEWKKKIEQAWRERPIIWLSGVRRSGKTSLCRSLPEIIYFDCELPSVRRQMQSPEDFLAGLPPKSRIVLDEIHRLDNPSELLKISADHFPDLRLIATGSSMLGASAKFRDTLAGRKRDLWLTPMTFADLDSFGSRDLVRRLLHGGLPGHFLADPVPEKDFQEWSDAYWARDIQELFRLERRHSYQRLVELLMRNNGGIFEATGYAQPCEISRPTVNNYLRTLEATFVAHLVRPFSGEGKAEITAAPKVFMFDTGFVCHQRGWEKLRPEDCGLLWEHLVLNELHAASQSRNILYWRDKAGHEIDFVWLKRGGIPVAIECKWTADSFSSGNLQIFRRRYPDGENYVVSPDTARPYNRKCNGLQVTFLHPSDLCARLGLAE